MRSHVLLFSLEICALLWSFNSPLLPKMFVMGFSSRRFTPRWIGISSYCVRNFSNDLRPGQRLYFSSQRPSLVSSPLGTIEKPTIRSLSQKHHFALFSSATNALEDTKEGSKNEDSEEEEVLTTAEDTIFALSSGFTGEQATAVAVIRISGPKATDVLQSLLKTSPTSTPKLPKYRQAALRKLYHPKDYSILDHALVLSFKGPNSFTGEDLVELQCHGSRVIVERLLTEALPSLGCRLAEPGEFTQRAFSYGKLDLVQVEALADILAAETHLQVEQGLKHLNGDVSKTYEGWRSTLVSGLAHAEAVIDFGDDEHLLLGDDYDEDVAMTDEDYQQQQDSVWGEVGAKMMQLKESMKYNLEDGRRGELIREGIKVAIIGPPNAGKSSLFNLLARRDAAIVSPIAGTTRDVLQVSMDLGGVKCTLQDTAGVRSDTEDILELEGMKRAKTVIQEADLVLAMIDVTDASYGMEIVQSVLEECGESDDEDDNSSMIDPSRMLLVRNKQDLMEDGTSINDEDDKQQRAEFGEGIFDISCQNQEGIDVFLNALTQKVVSRTSTDADSGSSGEGALITRARHRQHVEAAVMALERFAVLSREGSMAVDMAAEELRLAASELGRVTGAVDVEDVLDVLFSDFCIGK